MCYKFVHRNQLDFIDMFLEFGVDTEKHGDANAPYPMFPFGSTKCL